MAVRTLLQILPYRSRQSDGVGDYARLLATQLRDAHDIDTIFVVVRPDASTPDLGDGFTSVCVTQNRTDAIIAALNKATVGRDIAGAMLHMSGYGYSRIGAPLHLARALAAWKAASGTPIISIFHELFIEASGLGRRKLYQKLQQISVRRFLTLSDAALTPASAYRDWLMAQNLPCPVTAIPVFSNVGEANVDLSVARPSRLAIFCRADMAAEIYGPWHAVLAQFCSDAGITHIDDIGSRHQPPAEQIGPATITSHGRLPAEAISALLINARFGMLAYQHMPLAKSTLFAAYAAHGVIPLCASTTLAAGDGLVAGDNFVHMAEMDARHSPSKIDAKAAAAAVRAWYAPHALPQQATAIATQISQLAVRA